MSTRISVIHSSAYRNSGSIQGIFKINSCLPVIHRDSRVSCCRRRVWHARHEHFPGTGVARTASGSVAVVVVPTRVCEAHGKSFRVLGAGEAVDLNTASWEGKTDLIVHSQSKAFAYGNRSLKLGIIRRSRTTFWGMLPIEPTTADWSAPILDISEGLAVAISVRYQLHQLARNTDGEIGRNSHDPNIRFHRNIPNRFEPISASGLLTRAKNNRIRCHW